MDTLFPTESRFPSGFSYYPDFIAREEEQELYQVVSGISLHTFNFRGYEAKRKVMSFGYDYNFENRSISPGEKIPGVFDFLLRKVATHLHLNKEAFAEVLTTEYPAGSVINWHRDAPPFGLIAGISLMSDCMFKLRPYDKAKQGKGSIVSMPIQRRSLYIIRDEARHDWEHSIAPVKQTRYSITLRTLK